MHLFRFILPLFLTVFATITAQTFQYSKGWTNGKKRAVNEHPSIQEQQQAKKIVHLGRKIPPWAINHHPTAWKILSEYIRNLNKVTENGYEVDPYDSKIAKPSSMDSSYIFDGDSSSLF